MTKTSGLSLIELMFTVAIISIGIVATLGSFRYITTSIQHSKSKTLANNLVMEQVEKLKNSQYYSLLVTTSTIPGGDTRFNPPLVYDNGSYSPQTLLQGGMIFTRATRVDYAFQFGTSITTTSWTNSDTGLKMITVYAIWQDDTGWRYQEIRNLMANPAANPLNSSISGNVTDGGGNNIAGVLVRAVNYPNYYGTTDSSGNYQFSVSSGTYTLNASSQGYFSGNQTVSIASAQSLTSINFTLTKMATGTVSGSAYIDNHLVISEVVAATGTVAGGGGLNQDIEYIELYNPTTNTINIGTTAGNLTPNIVVVLWDNTNNSYIRQMVYLSTYVPVNAYYLISNTGGPSSPASTCNSFVVTGATFTPDACWQNVLAPSHAFECGNLPCSGPNSPDAGGISIANSSAYTVIPGAVNMASWPAARIDSIAWSKNASAHSAPINAREGTPVANGGGSLGLQPNELYIRTTHFGGVNTNFGRAYDANNNATDFLDWPSVSLPPSNSSTIKPPLAGTPAAGAYVTSNDALSSPARCDSSGNFSIPNVATGTWTVAYSTGAYYLEVNNVQMITPSPSTGVPNGSTSPTWPISAGLSPGLSNALLNNTTSYAFISGVVTDANNNPIPNLQINAGGKIGTTNSSGRYFISTSTGNVAVVANNGNQNIAYTSANSTILGTLPGQIYDYSLGSAQCSGGQCTWFQLSLAGTLVGYFQTSSLTPLPGQTLIANGPMVVQAVSDNSGHAFLSNLSTGTYTLSPSLDPMSSVVPSSATVTLTSTGTATNYSTFTVTSGVAQITGRVLIAASTQPITTGALVMASTTTLGGSSGSMPPAANGGLGALCAPCYYAVSSDATGNYTLNVRSSTTAYQLYGWYTTFSGTTPSTTRQGPFAVTVSAAGVIQSQDLTW